MKSYNTLTGFAKGEEPHDQGPRLQYYALLRIFSESGLDFARIGNALGVEPTKSRRRGERPGPRSPASTGDVWMYQPSLAATEPLHRHIDELWSILRPHLKFLRDLKALASVRVLLGYSSNIDHAGIVIPPGSLEMFVALDVPLELSIVVVVDE